MFKRRPNIILCGAGFVALILIFGAIMPRTEARAGENRAIAITAEPAETRVVFFLTAKTTLEATVRLTFDRLENATSSIPAPYEFVIDRAYDRKPLLILTQERPGRMFYHYKYSFKIGVASSKKTIDFLYSLPYSASQHCMVSQSYCGTFSHQRGTESENAVDFLMPEGTTILAARAGKVVGFRDDSTSGGPTQDYLERENYLIIKHDDGTYAQYVHLKHNGVLVKLGQNVSEGMPIALSGCTGMSKDPHLHFLVSRVLSAERIKSLPFQMKTPKGVMRRLMQGEIY